MLSRPNTKINALCDLTGKLNSNEEEYENLKYDCLKEKYNGYELALTSNTITDIYYIASKIKWKEEANKMIEELFVIFNAIDINEDDCISAYELPMSKSFEDGVLYALAKRHKVDCIITRNKKVFKDDDIKIYTSESFIDNNKKPW